jgi:serine/threonine protein kinase
MSLSPGTKLGQYEIRALLGVGGMGEVYCALDTVLKREVALKLLPENYARDPDRLARFRREAELLASLNHPNIAAIYGVYSEGDRNCLVMELVEGETLAEMIRDSRLALRVPLVPQDRGATREPGAGINPSPDRKGGVPINAFFLIPPHSHRPRLIQS